MFEAILDKRYSAIKGLSPKKAFAERSGLLHLELLALKNYDVIATRCTPEEVEQEGYEQYEGVE